MNENKTAITELIEWMENEDALVEEKRIDFLYLRILDKAKALESSQAEKDKGLWEAKANIERAMEGITERQTQEDSYYRGYYNCLEDTLDSINVQILSRHQSNPIDPDYNKHEVAMNGQGIPVCPECGTKIEACGDCADYAEFKAWKVPAPKTEAKTVDSVEFPCPTCGAERFKTERRMNGDSWCRFGHKHPTKDFVRPATLEPLAVLAVNKGCQVAWIGTYKSNPMMWSIEVQNAKKTEVFNAPTYAACEQLARTWLNDLKSKE